MTTLAAARPGRRPRPMSACRLEWLRLTRTPRAIALAGVYLFFGLLGPVTARYLQDIVNRAQSGVQIIVAQLGSGRRPRERRQCGQLSRPSHALD
jgi:hypothetical protein